MAEIEVIARIAKGTVGWAAAIAFIAPGTSELQTTSASDEAAARLWIRKQALARGIDENRIRIDRDA